MKENVNDLNIIIKIKVTFVIISELFKIEFENFERMLVDEKRDITLVNKRFLKKRRNYIVIAWKNINCYFK